MGGQLNKVVIIIHDLMMSGPWLSLFIGFRYYSTNGGVECVPRLIGEPCANHSDCSIIDNRYDQLQFELMELAAYGHCKVIRIDVKQL